MSEAEVVEVETQTVLLEHIYSMEYYKKENEEVRQVLQDISLETNQGEIWGVLGTSAFELRLLLEIIANARAYQKGKCILSQRGMLRAKRTILPHVYYIGSTNMLFDNMKVLEYLMYITAKQKSDVVDRQKEIFQKLIDLQLGYLSLSNIKSLTPSERAVITLVVASMVECEIIVWNIARLTYDERSLIALKCICEELKKEKKTLIFSSFQYSLMEEISTHVAGIHEGKLIYKGSTSELIDQWDHLSIMIEDERVHEMDDVITTELGNIEIHKRENQLEIWDHYHSTTLYECVLKTLCLNDLYPHKIFQHTKCLENAWKEVRNHDL